MTKTNSEDRKRKNSNTEDDSSFLKLSIGGTELSIAGTELSIAGTFRPMRARHSPPAAEEPLMPPRLSPPVSLHQQQKLSPPPIPPHHPKLSPSMHTFLSQSPPTPQMPLQLSPNHSFLFSAYMPEPPPPTPTTHSEAASAAVAAAAAAAAVASSSTPRPVRNRRNPTQGPREGKSDTVPPPFSWATNRRATVHSLSYLLQRQIFTITDEVQCKKCDHKYEMGFDLKEKFAEVWNFIAAHKSTMHDRAPSVWMNPMLPACKHCGQENSVKPLLAAKKKEINWLFLLLGQMLGCCTLEQLKYFCKHTKNHRTGAKDRVLYLTYLGLCKQLDPSGPFDR